MCTVLIFEHKVIVDKYKRFFLREAIFFILESTLLSLSRTMFHRQSESLNEMGNVQTDASFTNGDAT